jgi:endonuclease/exonuclease/phosphatase (EEP) superfamily protein YafD
MISKIPFTSSAVVFISNVGIPSVVGMMEIDGVPLTVLGTHPLRPGNKEYNRMRDVQLDATPAFLKQIETPILVLGDLNTTPWSFRFKRLLRDTGLLDSSKGRGIQPTWPTFWSFLRIPIDHCLHSPQLSILRKEIGPHVGSDHFPVIVDFALSGRQEEK